MEARNILAYLSIKYNGNWDNIYDAIKRKEDIVEDEVNKAIDSVHAKFITIIDEDYPKILNSVFKPPLVLFYYGDLSLISDIYHCISVVGSRKSSMYGELMTRQFVKELSSNKIIVSGLAKGIDSIAHQSSIDNGGKTVAILGSGIDYCYPKENKSLYDKIKEEHLLISEYPGETPPDKAQFPFRNRLIAGLSEITLVTEANDYKSGTLVTVRYALMFGRDVMCIPYHANEKSMCNRLIKEGACLVETPQDVISELKYQMSENSQEKNIL